MRKTPDYIAIGMWGKEVKLLTAKYTTIINDQLNGSNSEFKNAFEVLLKTLKEKVNNNIAITEVIEMLVLHTVTKPVFDLLFCDGKHVDNNIITIAMKDTLALLEKIETGIETKNLNTFYTTIQNKLNEANDSNVRYKLISSIYDKFIKAAFPLAVERLGIVFTPVEVVDFLINSAEYIIRKDFDSSITNKDVSVFDPYTGTGTFINRLLHSGIIEQPDIDRKITSEIYANEIILLSYYIASLNIESTYKDINPNGKEIFKNIKLVDTFQDYEDRGIVERVADGIQVIIGNPPYSVGQVNENDNNKNKCYPHIDKLIHDTYVKHSSTTSTRNLYDHYIRAIRLASEQIKDKGVICYITNGSFIETASMGGLRKCLYDEYTSIYVLTLRGFTRGRLGDVLKKEGENIFDIRTGVAIIVLVKNPDKIGTCDLNYYDIGDYLNATSKLDILSRFKSIEHVPWIKIIPNAQNEWVGKREESFKLFTILGDKKRREPKKIFNNYSLGVSSNRDAWVYNFSKRKVWANVQKTSWQYNQQVCSVHDALKNIDETFSGYGSKKEWVEHYIDHDPKKISWSLDLKKCLLRGMYSTVNEANIRRSLYRPFQEQYVYFDNPLLSARYRMPSLFPESNSENKLICIPGLGLRGIFDTIMTDMIPDYGCMAGSQCFPLYSYTGTKIKGYTKVCNVNESIVKDFIDIYSDATITPEDVFYYIYGVFNSPEYSRRFNSNFTKELDRVPYVKDFHAYSNTGKLLADIHLNYANAAMYPLREIVNGDVNDPVTYKVNKMIFNKIDGVYDKSYIIYNKAVTLYDIPLDAYTYKINNRPAIEWVMDRYKYPTHKYSGIVNDANDLCTDMNNNRYIIDLLKRVITVSINSNNVIDSLPPLNELNI